MVNKKVLPYGSSIMPAVMELDPTPLPLQLCYLLVLGILLLLIPLLPLVLTHPLLPFNLSDKWDIENGIEAYNFSSILLIMEKTLGLSRSFICNSFIASIAVFAVLFICDQALGLQWHHIFCNTALHSKLFRNMGVRTCYDEMFCEPVRENRLVACLGNTYSNFLYLFSGILVVASSIYGGSSTHLGAPDWKYNYFWASDLCFGLMLLILSVCSVMWHATNMPFAHYPDLWSMDSSISYLIIRVIMLGPHKYLFSHGGGAGQKSSESWGAFVLPGLCFMVFIRVVILLGKSKLDMCARQVLHNGCPFSGRQRFYNMGKLDNEDLFMSSVCLVAGMPVLYAIPLTVMQLLFFKSVGSFLALGTALTMLVIGWEYRMLERFCCDGCLFMNWSQAIPYPRVRTFVAAIVSPTAVMHWTTGITLISAYCAMRSLD